MIKNFFSKVLKYQEYNLDILNDLSGKYLHSCAKKKLFIRSGDTDKAQMLNNKIFTNFAKKLSKALKHVGIIDVDFFYNKKKILRFRYQSEIRWRLSIYTFIWL